MSQSCDISTRAALTDALVTAGPVGQPDGRRRTVAMPVVRIGAEGHGAGAERGTHEGAMDVAEISRHPLIDLLPEPVVAVDVGTRRFVVANAAAERLLGYSRAELLTMTPAEVLEPADGTRLELAFETL